MNDNKLIKLIDVSLFVSEIKSLMDAARNNIARQVNSELLNTYWNIGRIICEHEQSTPQRADYGKQTLKALSRELTRELGKGFSVVNCQSKRSSVRVNAGDCIYSGISAVKYGKYSCNR